MITVNCTGFKLPDAKVFLRKNGIFFYKNLPDKIINTRVNDYSKRWVCIYEKEEKKNLLSNLINDK